MRNTHTFVGILIHQELFRHLDNVSDDIKALQDNKDVLDEIPQLEDELIDILDG